MNDKSPSIEDSQADTEILKVTGLKICKKNSDQKLPIAGQIKKSPISFQAKSSFAYINKNGYAKIIQANFNEEKEARSNIIISLGNQSVPNNALNNSVASSASSDPPILLQTQGGHLQINTSMLVHDDYVDIKYEHVKYLNLVAILCCWCFPFTGIPALIYTFLMKKFYRMHDMILAKRYLLKAEKLVLMTFFFGFTFIAILFAVMQVYYFNEVDPSTVLSNNSTLNYKTLK